MRPGTLEYIFETDQEDLPQSISKEKVAEIAANFMTTFYHIQIGALETVGVSNDAGPIPAGLLFGRVDKRTGEANVFRRGAAQRNVC